MIEVAIACLIGGFAVGMLIGMHVGPSTEAREALHLEGYLDGLGKRRRDTLNSIGADREN